MSQFVLHVPGQDVLMQFLWRWDAGRFIWLLMVAPPLRLVLVVAPAAPERPPAATQCVPSGGEPHN